MPLARKAHLGLARSSITLALTALALILPSAALAAAWVPGPAITPANGLTPSAVKAGLSTTGQPVAGMLPSTGNVAVGQASELSGGAWSGPDGLAVVTRAAYVDPSGGVLALTTTTSGSLVVITSLATRYRPPGGPWGPSQPLASSNSNFTALDVRFAADGTAYAGWSPGGSAQAGFSIRTPGAAGTWSAPESPPALPVGRSAQSIAIGVAPNGEVTFLWDGVSGGNNYIVYAARRTPAAVWSGTATQVHAAFSGSVNPELPAVAVDGAGNATAAWYEAQTNQAAESARRPAGVDAWTAAAPVSTGLTPVGAGPAVAAASDGRATLAFIQGSTVQIVRRSTPAGAWSAPQPFPGTATSLSLAGDPSGAAVVAYADSSNGVHAAIGQLGAALGPVTDLAGGAAAAPSPAAATDAQGDALVLWRQDAQYDSALYDNSAPALAALGIPIQGTAGQPVTFSVSATDNWSAVDPAWDFGDLTPGANGSPVTHTYAQPGTYLVQVAAQDAAGARSTQSQQITVVAPPPAPQSPPPPRTLARPVAFRNGNLELVSGDVLVETPGTTAFVPLLEPEQVRTGSIIDARHGRVRITIANGHGGFDTADFYGGVFKFTQPKVKAGRTAFADLFLVFGSFKGCPAAPHNPKLAAIAKSKGRSVRHLWGEGKGAFRTVGRFSSATVRGTTWLTDDHCNGTLTKVTAGKVGVRDFVKRKTLIVKAHHSYFAAPRKKK
ncbi:MAG: PKD domain-containing protein [Thermoleophilaceae bacterium]